MIILENNYIIFRFTHKVINKCLVKTYKLFSLLYKYFNNLEK